MNLHFTGCHVNKKKITPIEHISNDDGDDHSEKSVSSSYLRLCGPLTRAQGDDADGGFRAGQFVPYGLQDP